MEVIITDNPFVPDDILDAVIARWETRQDGMTAGDLEEELKPSEPGYSTELLGAYLEKLTDERSLLSLEGKYYPFRALRQGLSERVEALILDTANRYNKTRIRNIDPGYFKEHHGISQGALNWVIRKLEREGRILTFSRTVQE
jgi:hypothetical protein